MSGEVILAADLDALPEEASVEKAYLRKMGVVSIASVPLQVSGEILGSMSFASTKRRVLWTDDLLQQLKMLAEIFSNALKRKHATHAFLISNAELNRSEIVLRESEERFRLVANTAPAFIWMSGTNNKCTFFNQGWLSFTGRSLDQELGEGWLAGVHPDDQERRLAIFPAGSDAPVEFEVEYRLRRFDGEYRWIVDHGVPRFGSDGIFCGYIGSCVDITDRKLSEMSLRELSGRLIHAQEEERTRIARELHDDLSQRIVLLSISLEQFGQGRPGLSSTDREQLRNIEQGCYRSVVHNPQLVSPAPSIQAGQSGSSAFFARIVQRVPFAASHASPIHTSGRASGCPEECEFVSISDRAGGSPQRHEA